MRLILLDYKDDSLFGKKVCSESASFFKKHKESYKRMIVEQGRDFWIYLSISFKAYCLKNRILYLAGASSEKKIFKMIEKTLEVVDQMLTNGHVKDGMKLCEDLIVVHEYRSFIDDIHGQSVMTNPFYMWDSEKTFCRLFGQPIEERTLHFVQVITTLQYLLHLGGCLFEMLRRWLHAEECKQDVTIYWKPPPERLFHVFGVKSPTLIKAYTVINKYERCLLDKTMYEVTEETKDGRHMVDFKIDYNSPGSEDEDPRSGESNSVVISIVNEDTKEVTKRVKLRYPRWQTTTYSRNPGECPGCEDHLECIRKQVIDEGYVLPKAFEVFYEPYFHVKLPKQQTEATECDGTTNHDTNGPSVASAKSKDKGLTRKALKQIGKKERRHQRKKKAGDESLDKQEAVGLQKFVDACRKVPGFIEELERLQPKKIVGVPLPEGYQPELTRPAPGSECRVRILDPHGNEMDVLDRNAILEEEIQKRLLKQRQIEAAKKKNVDEGVTSSKEEDNNDKDGDEEREDKGSKDEDKDDDSDSLTTNLGNASKEEEKQSVREMKQNEPSNMEMKKKKDIPDSEMKQNGQILDEKLHQNDHQPHTDQKEHVPRTEMKQMEQNPDPGVKQMEQAPITKDQSARCLSAEDERTAVNGLDDHQGEGSKETTGTNAIELSDEVTENHKLRQCALCGKKEDQPKTYKKCQQCRQEKIKQAKFYCSRDCQVQDWKRRHWKEHLEKETEPEPKKTPRVAKSNEPLVDMDEGYMIIGLNSLNEFTKLDDVD
nr:axoneme-associated protein mst101(2)-like isoform X1 [Lytechinus pictus]